MLRRCTYVRGIEAALKDDDVLGLLVEDSAGEDVCPSPAAVWKHVARYFAILLLPLGLGAHLLNAQAVPIGVLLKFIERDCDGHSDVRWRRDGQVVGLCASIYVDPLTRQRWRFIY